jgi:serine/tyrosine/threonine adenylyltransferase
MMLTFDNRFLRAFPGDVSTSRHSRQVQGAMWSRVEPTPVAAPRLIAHSREVAAMLGLSDVQIHSIDMVNALAGNGTLPGMETYATVYGGHQFGNWAGQLGDGRAILLGEVVAPDKQRYELQLKGAGPTPYSRRADGRAVLRSSIREFLCSEAMHHLGVPTTRALSLVTTGDDVLRDMFYNGDEKPEPGAIVCRVAPSFLRFGHFEIFASRGETALLQQLVDFTIANYFPQHLIAEKPVVALFTDVCERTAKLMAEWMRVGFVHGVMNTDNMSILGLTIDYGPYGWVDNFDGGWTPNTTDAGGKRYCFGRQPGIARWNLARLADALLTLGGETEDFEFALKRFDEIYNATITEVFAAKFGFDRWRAAEDGDSALVDSIFALMTQAEVDMTDFFRRLAAAKSTDDLRDVFYVDDLFNEHRSGFDAWMTHYLARIGNNDLSNEARVAKMNGANPRYVLRNYLAQEAIDAAHQGDISKVTELLDVMHRPYDEQPSREAFAAKRPDWARHKAGCSMLSCSS